MVQKIKSRLCDVLFPTCYYILSDRIAKKTKVDRSLFVSSSSFVPTLPGHKETGVVSETDIKLVIKV